MGAVKRFQRQYMIFSNEDPGFDSLRKPSGYVSIEVREGKGKLISTVQNLRQGNGKYEYVLYLIGNINGRTVPVRTGQFMTGANKTYLEWSFDPENVGFSGYSIDEFDVAAVLVEYADGRRGAVICPLAAYKSKKQEWRKGFNAAIAEEMLAKQVKSQYEEEAKAQQYKPQYEWESKEQQYEPGYEGETEKKYKTGYEDAESDIEAKLYKPGYESDVEAEQHKHKYEGGIESGIFESVLDDYMKTGQHKPGIEADKEAEKYKPEHEGDIEDKQHKWDYEGDKVSEQEKPDYSDTLPSQDYDSGLGKINIDCVYLNGNMCGAFVNQNVSGANLCEECKIRANQSRTLPSTAKRMQRLKEELNRYFQQCDPFRSRRSDYTWWNVNNPVNLNNILFGSGIRSPLLFNPAVMLAHYKYKHLIIGIFQHKETEKQYVVCGVPSMYMVDQKPFGEMSRWAQAEGSRIRYGAFGYWLVYIDPANGKMLNLN